MHVGRGFAVLGALLALSAYWPRQYQVTDVRALRDHYLAAEPEFTRLHLLDTQIGMTDNSRTEIGRKATRLKLAMISLAIAAVLVGAGAALH